MIFQHDIYNIIVSFYSNSFNNIIKLRQICKYTYYHFYNNKYVCNNMKNFLPLINVNIVELNSITLSYLSNEHLLQYNDIRKIHLIGNKKMSLFENDILNMNKLEKLKCLTLTKYEIFATIDIKNIKFLEMYDCVSYIKKNFHNRSNLKSLKITKTIMDIVCDDFIFFESLEYLYIDTLCFRNNNNLFNIKLLKNLKYLNVEIKIDSDILKSLKKLEYLNCKYFDKKENDFVHNKLKYIILEKSEKSFSYYINTFPNIIYLLCEDQHLFYINDPNLDNNNIKNYHLNIVEDFYSQIYCR